MLPVYRLKYRNSISGVSRFKSLGTNVTRPPLGSSHPHKAFLEVKRPQRAADHSCPCSFCTPPIHLEGQYTVIQETLPLCTFFLNKSVRELAASDRLSIKRIISATSERTTKAFDMTDRQKTSSGELN
jgi:hypothetical protein